MEFFQQRFCQYCSLSHRSRCDFHLQARQQNKALGRFNLPVGLGWRSPSTARASLNHLKEKKKTTAEADVYLSKYCPKPVLWSTDSLCFGSGAPHPPVLIWSLIFRSEQEWLFRRSRSGFGTECYVTWYMGQNNSITYETAVQIEVMMEKGELKQTARAAILLGHRSGRHTPESFFYIYFKSV